MALIRNIGEFVESQESWIQYNDRMEQFFSANDIVAAKRVPVLLATVDPVAFRILGNLVAPDKPATKSYDALVQVMTDFYNHTPLVTVQRYKFFSRFRQSEESISTFVDWAAPIVPVMKQDKSVRICGDFKLAVNRPCKLDRHPIPKSMMSFQNCLEVRRSQNLI